MPDFLAATGRVGGFLWRGAAAFCTAAVIMAANAGEWRSSVTEVGPIGTSVGTMVVAALPMDAAVGAKLGACWRT